MAKCIRVDDEVHFVFSEIVKRYGIPSRRLASALLFVALSNRDILYTVLNRDLGMGNIDSDEVTFYVRHLYGDLLEAVDSVEVDNGDERGYTS